MDPRDFKLWDSTKFVVIRPPAQFTAFHYLRMLVPLPLLAWYWAGESLHRLELQWVRDFPAAAVVQPLAQFCSAAAAAPCDAYVPIAHLHTWSLAMLLFVLKFMMLVATLPKWPQTWQAHLLRHAAWVGGLGLIVTLLLVMARGAIAATAVWLIPPLWWGAETKAVQLAPVLALIAIMRVPPHAKAAWRLWARFTRQRVGREVSRQEQPTLWALIDRASHRLGVAGPSRLVLGVFPDCRLEIGKMKLEPTGQVLRGATLYLGMTLSVALEEWQMLQLIEQALLRQRGVHGAWLPAVEDWLESTDTFLRECKDKRASMEMGNAADPALCCWEIWLQLVRQMATPFQTEHAHACTADMQQELAQQGREVKTMLVAAQQAYRQEVFILFIVNLTSGVACPAVFRWFAKAFAQHYPPSAAYTPLRADAALSEEVVLLEKEWLIKTGQANTPTDCWELRAA